MKNYLSWFSIENLKKEIFSTFMRFPLACIGIIINSCILFALIHSIIPQAYEGNAIQGLISIYMTSLLSIGLALSGESFGYGRQKNILLSFVSLIFGILFYFSFGPLQEAVEDFIHIFVAFIGIFSFLFFALFLQNIKKYSISETKYSHYFYILSIHFVVSSILGGILTLFGFIALGSISLLFGYQFSSLYGDWATLSLSLFAPIFFISHIPHKKELKDTLEQNKFFDFLLQYIALPFLVFYFAILYIYSLKVLANFSDWPKGEVSWLVIGFSFYGYLFYIFSWYKEHISSSIKIVRKYFPYFVLPQTGMLFYAIYLRIVQYDLTVNRYFVIIFGIWLILISLYYIFSKKKFLFFIPLTLTLFTIIISIGPWSVYQLPEQRQSSRLQKNLVTLKILENDVIHPLKNENKNPEIEKEIYEGIEYLCTTHNCETIEKIFSVQYQDFLKKHKEDYQIQKETELKQTTNEATMEYWKTQEYTPPSHWEIINAITQSIGVENSNYTHSNWRNYTLGYDYSHFPISVENYTFMIPLENWKKSSYQVHFDGKNQTLLLQDISENTLETISLKEYLAQLEQSQKNGAIDFSPEEMTFSFIGETYEGKIYFESLSYEIVGNSAENSMMNDSGNVSGYLLLRQK